MKRLGAVALLLLLFVAAAAAIAQQLSIGPITPPARTAFSRAQVEQGAVLAAIGDCAVCHTAPHGQPYAGGRGVPTPFGRVYATNITPDPATGIGTWSEAAFSRAMRQGIARDGAHLYPVLPYPHFTRATDADITALYAFLMTRTPVASKRPPNPLPFPLNQRVVLAAWNRLFLRPGVWQPDPAHDAAWNRGAYLVDAVGHCGACHTPHNRLGGEESGVRLGGGQAEDWYAPPLQAASPAREPWTEAALATYLRTGFQAQHGAAAGPMTAVTTELAAVPTTDVDAMAHYVAALMPARRAEPVAGRRAESTAVRPVPDEAGRVLFAGACGACHAADAPMRLSGAPSLALDSNVNAALPQGVIQVILLGIPWREGQASPYMPGFANALTDAQIASIAAYVRAAFTNQPAWPDLKAQVTRLRRAGESS